MDQHKIIIPIILVAALVFAAPFLIHPAEAHILKTFSNISVKIGFQNEPPLVGDTNFIQIYIYNGTSDTAPPISDSGLDHMTVSIQYGGHTRDITSTFTPSDDTPGLYFATFRPTQIGSYTVTIQGSINGVTIPPTTYPMDTIEAKDKYYFPSAPTTSTPITGVPSSASQQASSASPATSSAQLSQNVINQITNDINDAKNTADNAAQSYATVAASFQDVKNTTNTLYILSMAGIGIGAAGVVVAVVALTRKNQV